jgi:hypothetical protein
MRRRDHPGAGEAGGPDQVVHAHADQRRKEEKQPARGRGKAARGHRTLADIGDGSALGPVFVVAAWQAGKAFGAQHFVNGREAERVPLLLQASWIS